MQILLSILTLATIGSLSNLVHSSGVVVLTHNNAETELESAKVVFVNFYADWCRFSQMLKPIFEQTADILKEEYPGDLKLAKIDCENEQELCQRYHVSKYPTLKVFRNGQPAKKEFRGQRTVDGLSKFCREQLTNKIHEFHTLQDLNPEESKRNIIGYFEAKDSENYKTFESVADDMRDECEFHVGFGEASAKERQTGENVVFKTRNRGTVYEGQLNNAETLKAWASDKCVPLVREITFENAEELTEEGIPFLLLFHHPSDKTSPELYKNTISSNFINHKGTINFLTADGVQFSHPLHHLGKSGSDLPLIAIDSFRHMYTFPKFDDIKNPSILERFINDFHSGKLHREFHHGPDVTEQPKVENNDGEPNGHEPNGHEPNGHLVDEDGQPIDPERLPVGEDSKTDPPETIFKKLKPSHDRYTLLRDEL